MDYTEPSTGAFFQIVQVPFKELIPFLNKEALIHISQGTQDGNNCYLGFDVHLKRDVKCHVAYHGEEIVAFAMVSKRDPRHLTRLYTTPRFRRFGLGRAFIFGLDINSLGCLKENHEALALYKRLGFEPLDESSIVMSLRKTK